MAVVAVVAVVAAVFVGPITVTEIGLHPAPPTAHIVSESVPALTPVSESVKLLLMFPCATFIFSFDKMKKLVAAPESPTFKLCPTVIVGLATLNTTAWFAVDGVTLTFNMPHRFSVSQTVIVELPVIVAKTMIPLPDIPPETIEGLEILVMLYVPVPPVMGTVWLLPAGRETLLWPNESPDPPDELDEPDPFTVTETVLQLFEVSQILIVALPAAVPETVSVLPARPSETALVLELFDILYVPVPPETVTVWLLPTERERLF